MSDYNYARIEGISLLFIDAELSTYAFCIFILPFKNKLMNQSAQISLIKSCIAIEYHLSVWYWNKMDDKIQILEHTYITIVSHIVG